MRDYEIRRDTGGLRGIISNSDILYNPTNICGLTSSGCIHDTDKTL